MTAVAPLTHVWVIAYHTLPTKNKISHWCFDRLF